MTSETGKTARLLFSRPAFATNTTITVHYQLSGTATSGVDVEALPGSVILPAGTPNVSVTVSAINDAIPEGDKTLTLTLAPGTDYQIGALNTATVRVLDTPFDGWRFKHFSASELTQPEVSGPETDPDQDGASNWQEFLAGTDPHNAASVLRVRIDAATNTAVIQFLAGANRAFTLQYRDDLRTGNWQDFTNLAPAEIARTIVCTDVLPAGLTNRFYRVRVP